ncbi:MAG: hypothetical protein M1833_002751 [Piccolia ochrophora]|nr:MAG: hypothetical protein M1833_002751 [Piccolia ochrophora]
MGDPRDNVKRGHGFSLVGTATFTLLRLADPFLQHQILTRHVGLSLLPKYFGGTLLPAGEALSPFQLLMLGMAGGSALKHAFWALAVAKEELPLPSAFMIAAFNTIFNSLSTVFSLWSVTSAVSGVGGSAEAIFTSPYVAAGTLLYVTGIFLETVSEIQRKRFKDDERNKGKPYSGGLFGWARHINYAGYTLWRGGYALAAGGPFWGAAVMAFFAFDFHTRGIPALDQYCRKRYGDAWTEVKRKVPFVMIPGIW